MKSIKDRCGDEKIIMLANKLLEAITAQGYCVRSQGDFASVCIGAFWLNNNAPSESHNRVLELNSICNARGQKWSVRGKLTAPLIPERDEQHG